MEDAKQQAIRAHELHQLKKEAIVYYQNNGVPLKMEDALNKMFKDRPQCVFGYLANFFNQLADPPVINGIRAFHCCDTRGFETLAVDVTCKHKNEERRFGRSRGVLQPTVFEHDKQEEKDKELQEMRQHVEAGLKLVNDGPLKELVDQRFDPRHQRVIDEFLAARMQAEEERVKAELQRELELANAAAASAEGAEESPQHLPEKAKPEKAGSAKKKGGKGGKEVVIVPDEPREGVFPGCLALSCVSSACATAGAAAAGEPLYRHLRRILNAEQEAASNEWRLPLPMLTVLSGGKASPGKSNCIKEYMIVPRPGLPFDRMIQDATAVYQHVAKSLGVKGGPAVRFTNDVGSLNTVIDRPETGFDLINEALKALELTESFDLAANIAGHELFDYEKGKYDLAQGAQKTPDEFADFLDDLSAKQPALIALIDPLRRAEREAWTRLCQKASQRCLIIGDATQHRPGRLLAELDEQQASSGDLPTEDASAQPLLASGWVARLQQRNTVTELLDCAKRMRQAGSVIVAASGPSETTDTTIVDLAVAMGARYIKVGAPIRGERVDKLLRLVEIGEELQKSDQLVQWEQLRPPLLRPKGADTMDGEGQPQQQTEPSPPLQSAGKSRKSSTSAGKS